jgi:hypothetical protein
MSLMAVDCQARQGKVTAFTGIPPKLGLQDRSCRSQSFREKSVADGLRPVRIVRDTAAAGGGQIWPSYVTVGAQLQADANLLSQNRPA